MDVVWYMPYAPRPADIWGRWSFSADAPDAARVCWERHGITLPHTIYRLWDIATLDVACGLWRITK